MFFVSTSSIVEHRKLFFTGVLQVIKKRSYYTFLHISVCKLRKHYGPVISFHPSLVLFVLFNHGTNTGKI